MTYEIQIKFLKNTLKAMKNSKEALSLFFVMWLLSMTFYLPFSHWLEETADLTLAMSSMFLLFTWLKKKLKKKDVLINNRQHSIHF